ncbi:MAG: hypothetical protein CL912_13435 [Deltaproteobacteria bacterium]|nr:hypothetical protein [Deltaproteobacteria bacterium]
MWGIDDQGWDQHYRLYSSKQTIVKQYTMSKQNTALLITDYSRMWGPFSLHYLGMIFLFEDCFPLAVQYETSTSCSSPVV